MLKLRFIIALTAAFLLAPCARAQSPDFYQLKDTAGTTFHVAVFDCPVSKICPLSVSSDSSGNPLSGPIGVNNGNGTALYVQGVTSGIPVSVTITGTLPPYAATPHFICDSGCSGGGGGGGTSSTFGVAFPAAGTAIGLYNGVNMVPLQFGQAVAGASLPVVLPAAQITALTPPTSVGITGTLPAFATTPTVNLGILNGAATASLQTTANSSLASLVTNQTTNSATTTHTCSVSGYSELGCLGQIDDDIKGPIAQVTAPLNAGAAVATNSLIIGGQYLSTQPTITNTQQAGLLVSSRGELLITPGASGFPVSLTGILNSGSDGISSSLNNAQVATFGYYLDPASGLFSRVRGNSIGSFVNGFLPSSSGTYATLTATGTSANVALPTGNTVYFQNAGTTTVSCTLGYNSGVTATANEVLIPPSSSFPFTVTYTTAGLPTYGACIDQTGSASNLVVLVGGTGLGTAFGGGGSAGSSGGAVYGPTAIGSANANPPVVIGGTVTGAAGQNVQGLAIKPASTAPLATDQSAVTAESPNSQLSVAVGTTADTAYTGSGSASLVAIAKGIYTVASGPVASGTNTIGAVTQASGPWTMNVTQVLGVAISATNGLFSNILQGNVALSATNGVYANQLQGNAILSQTNPSFAAITDGANKAAVKPASTPSVATDPALVVDVKPGCGACITPGPATPALSVPMVAAAYSPTHITTATTTTSKSGAGALHTVCINSLGTVASAVTIYDNTAASGTVLGVINSLALLGCQTYDVAFGTGLTLVTTGTVPPDVTVSWR